MFPFFYDWTFLMLIPALILAGWAQWKVRSAYKTYSRVPTRARTSGGEVAARILSGNSLDGVRVEAVSGTLTDHYDPRTRVVRLSEQNYRGSSVAAVSIAAHEVGHALQHGLGYGPLVLRTAMYPMVSFSSTLAFPLFFIGFLASIPFLVDAGIVLFAVAVLFSVITLPVEFNASRRALVQLEQGGILAPDELDGSRKVLQAAALTYVAATTMAVLQLLRLLILRGSRD